MNRCALATAAVTTLVIITSAPARGGIALIGESEADGVVVGTRSESLESVAVLPPDVRTLVLEASLEPDLLEALALLRAATNREMSELVAGLPHERRQLAWLILAHPELVTALNSAAAEPAALLELLSSHPEPVAEAGRTLLREDAELVRAIDALQKRASSHFESLLIHRSLATQITYRRLLDEPHALRLVMTEQSLLRSLGVLYRHDGPATHRALDQIAGVAIDAHAPALPGWESTHEVQPPALPLADEEAEGVVVADGVRLVDAKASGPDGAAVPITREVTHGDAAPVAATATHLHPVRRPPVSVWLGGCGSRSLRGATARPGRLASWAGPSSATPTSEASSRRGSRARRPAGGGPVLVWPRPGSSEATPSAASTAPVKTISFSRHGTPARPRIDGDARRKLERAERKARMRSALARRAARLSRGDAHPRRSSMGFSRPRAARKAFFRRGSGHR